MKTCIKCGSHAFNLYAEGIDQGGFCDVHYWQGRAHRAEAQPAQSSMAYQEGMEAATRAANESWTLLAKALVLAERKALIRYFDGHWRSDWSDGQIIEALEARGNT